MIVALPTGDDDAVQSVGEFGGLVFAHLRPRKRTKREIRDIKLYFLDAYINISFIFYASYVNSIEKNIAIHIV